MKSKEEILKQLENGNADYNFQRSVVELLADLRDGLGERLGEIVGLLKEIEYFERTRKP